MTVKCLGAAMVSLHRWAAAGGRRGGGGGDSDGSESDETTAGGDQAEAEAAWYRAAKERKVTLSSGIELFQRNAVKGLRALQAAGMVGRTAAEAAAFLHATPTLSKTAVGELLGEHEEEHLAIMHAYADAVDFSNTPLFDQALRHFLSVRLSSSAAM